MKKIIFTLLFISLSLSITNASDLIKEDENIEIIKNEEDQNIKNKDAEEIETLLEEIFTEETNKILDEVNNNSDSTITATGSSFLASDELPETGPEEFILLFLTLILSSSIFIRKKFK